MIEGTITKGVGGFYYVKTLEGKTFQCKARGLFRKDGITPYVGDRVKIELTDETEAYIINILPRKNKFVRPPIANVDCFLITVAVRKPNPNFYIIDKFLTAAEYQHTDIIICLNKLDLAAPCEVKDFIDVYKDIYPVVGLSGKTGEGLPDLLRLFRGRKCAFAGPSGTGKSTLLNCLYSGVQAETAEVSEKTEKGKHTTRHVELFELPDGSMIYDTPGFTSFEVLDADEEELEHLYPEMEEFLGKCKFHNCRHIKEPGCRIRLAVDEGEIVNSRYDSYVRQLKEIQEKRKF